MPPRKSEIREAYKYFGFADESVVSDICNIGVHVFLPSFELLTRDQVRVKHNL